MKEMMRALTARLNDANSVKKLISDRFELGG
jgi:hypothetical protein